MKDIYWKILGVILLLYTLIAGLGVPLKHGIKDVTPTTGKTATELKVNIIGYNSHYLQDAESLRAWLRMDLENSDVEEFLIQAHDFRVEDDRHVQIGFNIPEYLPTTDRVKDFSLILDSPNDGATVIPQAIFITQDSIYPQGAKSIASAPMENLNMEWKFAFPYRNILYETIRNTYYHVALWFAMLFLFGRGIWFGYRYLKKGFDPIDDAKAASFTAVGLLMGILGLVTGAIWAKYTWGDYWSNDPKQVSTAIALLIYLAYFVLRDAFEDEERKGRIAAVFSIFAFVALLLLIYVVPRITESLHPGNGGNPAFGSDDLDNTMRMVFYPSIIAWSLIGAWLANIFWRMRRLEIIEADKE